MPGRSGSESRQGGQGSGSRYGRGRWGDWLPGCRAHGELPGLPNLDEPRFPHPQNGNGDRSSLAIGCSLILPVTSRALTPLRSVNDPEEQGRLVRCPAARSCARTQATSSPGAPSLRTAASELPDQHPPWVAPGGPAQQFSAGDKPQSGEVPTHTPRSPGP